MYKSVLGGINAEKGRKTSVEDSKSQPSEDAKVESSAEVTNMDFVNKNRDFSKISEKDLEAAFLVLRKRCSDTWNEKLEIRTKDFNDKITMLKNVDLTRYLDPKTNPAGTVSPTEKNYRAKHLMIYPELWDMTSIERGVELRQLLHHLTIFAPFEGRPFVRAWMNALIPCFSRWILLSDTGNKVVIRTLKNFLSAFGQPGIVVCMSDKGAAALQTLKLSARSVEALGRGTVERYYWKRLAESSLGQKKAWQELASIPNKPLQLSQLDTLPEKWILDAGDWVHVLANVVSPEITDRFEIILRDIIDDGKMDENILVHPGPAKTLARSVAKSHEYMTEFYIEKSQRWDNFNSKFKSTFRRDPSRPEDFVWNVIDFARCSIVVPTASDLLKVKKLIEKKLSVVCVKNGYGLNCTVKGSGYRDLKLLVKVDFDGLNLKGIPKEMPKTTMICEIQLLCDTWLHNKKTTSLSYKVLRASTLRDLLFDFSKYLNPTKSGNAIDFHIDATKVLKNGWINLAKVTDFSKINASKLLLEASKTGWEVAGAELLVNKLGANIETKDAWGNTPAIWCSRKCHTDLLLKLIDLRANIENVDKESMTCLHHAARCNQEEAVRVLVEAKASLTAKEVAGKSPHDYAIRAASKRILKMLKGKHVPRLKKSDNKKVSKMDKLMVAAVERSLADFFDTNDVEISAVTKLFATQAVATVMENILQVLWFAPEVDHVDNMGFTAICYTAQHGTLKTLNVMIEAGTNVNVQKGSCGWGPLHFAIQFGTPAMVTALLDAKADVEVSLPSGWNALLMAAAYRGADVMSLLLEAKVNTYTKLDSGSDVFRIIRRNRNNEEDLMRLIKAARSNDIVAK